MKRGGLVVEHDVVRARDAHDEVDPGHPQQRQQGVHVVLIGFGMVGVADVTAHRHAEQLAAEVIFKTGTDDLLAVVQVFGADKTDHGVHQKRLEMSGHGVGAGFAGLLIDTVVSVGREGAALAGFEIHQVVPEGPAFQAQACVITFLQYIQIDAETGVGRFGAGDGLEHQVQRHAAIDHLDRGGDMGQHAGLGRDLIALDDCVEHFQERADG